MWNIHILPFVYLCFSICEGVVEQIRVVSDLLVSVSLSCFCIWPAPDRKPPDDDIVFASKRRNRDIWEAALVISFNYRKTKRQRILAFCQLRSAKNFLFDSLPNPNCKTKCFDNQTYSIQLDIVFQNLASVNSKPIL